MRTIGIHITESAVRNHISTEMAKELISKISNCVPFAVPGLSVSSSSTIPSPTSPSSSSLDSVFDVNRYTENPVPERSGSCEWEVIVQGDEGPFGGVGQVVGCHEVPVGHQEREEEEIEQEVESDGEKTLKERCTWMACG